MSEGNAGQQKDRTLHIHIHILWHSFCLWGKFFLEFKVCISVRASISSAGIGFWKPLLLLLPVFWRSLLSGWLDCYLTELAEQTNDLRKADGCMGQRDVNGSTLSRPYQVVSCKTYSTLFHGAWAPFFLAQCWHMPSKKGKNVWIGENK